MHAFMHSLYIPIATNPTYSAPPPSSVPFTSEKPEVSPPPLPSPVTNPPWQGFRMYLITLCVIHIGFEPTEMHVCIWY